MNAKYNALLLAREDYSVANSYILNNYQENYETTLPIFFKIDSTKLDSALILLVDAVKKTSIVAERHSNSRYLDEAYLLLGKARLSKQEIYNAIETFKYVNTNAKTLESKNEALIWLMRAYIENEDFNTANQVAEILKTQSLNKRLKSLFLITKAYYHQKLNQDALAVVFLEEGLKNTKRNQENARLHFIAAQLYDKLGNSVLARKRYKSTLKNKPIYDLEFNANLGLIMNQSLAKNTNIEFEEMLDDRKNQDLKDKVYFKMGELESRKQNYAKSIEYYALSIANSSGNLVQKAYTYKAIADIYFDKLNNFETAATYYDSTLITIPKDFSEYRNLSQRALSLNDFIKYKKVLDLEDSLQKLASLNPVELDFKLEQIILAKKNKAKKLEQEAIELTQKNNATALKSSNKKLWVLYDPVAMINSKNDFVRLWGNRNLEDNWRRADKETGSISFKLEKNVVDTAKVIGSKVKTEDVEAKEKADINAEKAEMVKKIPLTPIQLAASRRKQEEAYYQLGKIYKLKFQDEVKAKETFITLTEKYPSSVYDPEALYFLAIMSPVPNESSYAATLKQKYPYSSFARQVKNGNVKLTQDREAEAQGFYSEVYKLYEEEKYETVIFRLEKGLNDYMGSQIEDKMAMLRLLSLSKFNDKEKYLISLNDFVRTFPTSDLILKAKNMLKTVTK